MFLKLSVLFFAIMSVVVMPKAHAAPNFKWYSDGSCGMMTPKGHLIYKVQIEHCAKALGTKYKWYSDGSCGYMTSKNDLIYKTEINHCAKELGTKYRWYSDGSCGYMTSKNDLIYKTEIEKCAKELGTAYKWYSDGSCGYMTSKDDLIYKVDIRYCLEMDEKIESILAIDSSPRVEGKNFNRSPSVVEAYGRAKASNQ